MTKVIDLPRDLAEEVLTRVPLTSMRAVRLTCKKWNTLFKHRSFTDKQIGEAKKHVKEFQAIMTMNSKVYLMSINLDGVHRDDNEVESSIKQKGTLTSLNNDDTDTIAQSHIFHCSGLLLFIARNISRLVVWNPYSNQTRFIQPRISYHMFDNYALGYEMKKNKGHRSHKLLRFLDSYDYLTVELYNFDSNSWKLLPVTPFWNIPFSERGVSLKGNTYWLAQKSILQAGEEEDGFLLCFDFTTERFGSRLALPFNYVHINDTVTLSTVREEQLAVLHQEPIEMYTEIWISNKIEPNAVSWSTKLFLLVNRLRPLKSTSATFFVDEKNKVAVVFNKGVCVYNPTRNTAYIVGEDGYIKQVDLGESLHQYSFPLVCSYVPSSVQI